MRGTVLSLAMGVEPMSLVVTVQVDQGIPYTEKLQKLRGVRCDIDIKKHREKRSLTANGYMWALLTALAIELSKESPTTADDLHDRYVYQMPFKQISIPKDALDYARSCFRYMQVVKEDYTVYSQLGDPVDSVVIRIYKGTSDYDTQEMRMILDMIIQDCNAIGVETLTPEEKERLLNNYAREINNSSRDR